ncbi:hypothetical protein [Phormidium nigroviride]
MFILSKSRLTYPRDRTSSPNRHPIPSRPTILSDRSQKYLAKNHDLCMT